MKMTLKILFATLLLLSEIAFAYADEKPNIVFVMLDDAGYGDLGCYGQEKFLTPNIDRLAREGMKFTDHYAGSTVCAPTRCCLMTGLHTGHAQVRGNREVKPEGQYPLRADTVTIPKLIKQAGYVCGAFGKWGLGSPQSAGRPLAQGFDRFFGYNCQREAHTYYPGHLWDDDKRKALDGKTYSHDVIMDQALEFIRANRDGPFFCFLPHEEWWNCITHTFGFVVSVIAACFMILSMEGKSWLIQAATTAFVFIMIALYASSALSHYHHRTRWRSLFRKLDQAFIFLFIVAGFTPYFAVHLQETWAWIGVGLMWIAAITGFVSKLIFGHRIEGIATWTYLTLGWVPASIMLLVHSMPISAILYIVAGGVVYTAGVWFLMNDHKHWFFHSIWHIMVMLGTTIHYWGIMQSLAH